MSKKSYFELLKDPRWQKKRLEILQSNNFECCVCGTTTETLHVHHGAYLKNKKPWEYEDDQYHVVCEHCHKVATKDQQILLGLIAKLDPLSYHPMMNIVAGCQDMLRLQSINQIVYGLSILHFIDMSALTPIGELILRENKIRLEKLKLELEANTESE